MNQLVQVSGKQKIDIFSGNVREHLRNFTFAEPESPFTDEEKEQMMREQGNQPQQNQQNGQQKEYVEITQEFMSKWSSARNIGQLAQPPLENAGIYGYGNDLTTVEIVDKRMDTLKYICEIKEPKKNQRMNFSGLAQAARNAGVSAGTMSANMMNAFAGNIQEPDEDTLKAWGQMLGLDGASKEDMIKTLQGIGEPPKNEPVKMNINVDDDALVWFIQTRFSVCESLEGT